MTEAFKSFFQQLRGRIQEQGPGASFLRWLIFQLIFFHSPSFPLSPFSFSLSYFLFFTKVFHYELLKLAHKSNAFYYGIAISLTLFLFIPLPWCRSTPCFTFTGSLSMSYPFHFSSFLPSPSLKVSFFLPLVPFQHTHPSIYGRKLGIFVILNHSYFS